MAGNSPFASFWMAGYECCDMVNRHGDRVDLLRLTGHLEKLEEDYRLLNDFEMHSVREGIRWSVVEMSPGVYNWTEVSGIIHTAVKSGKQVLFDLCHFGFPSDLTPFHPHFTSRFEALCRSFVALYRSIQPRGPLIVTPVNEVNFMAWLGGEVAGTAPYCSGKGWDVKYHLMRAFIAGVKAMKEMDPQVLIMTVEPLVNIAADETDADSLNAVQLMNGYQFQTLDMLCGLICPELDGRPEYLDIIGLDYYYNSQWSYPLHRRLDWKMQKEEPGYRCLSDQVRDVYERYKRPVVITETSHPLEDRPLWIQHITAECIKILAADIPLWGICIYPVIDRPDWDYPGIWHRSGIWDIDETSEQLHRILYEPYAAAIKECQQQMARLAEPEPTSNVKNLYLLAGLENEIKNGILWSRF